MAGSLYIHQHARRRLGLCFTVDDGKVECFAFCSIFIHTLLLAYVHRGNIYILLSSLGTMEPHRGHAQKIEDGCMNCVCGLHIGMYV